MRKSMNSKRGSTSAAATAARSSSTRRPTRAPSRPSCFVYGTFFSPPASPYRWSDGGATFSANIVHPQGARPQRPLGLLRAVRDEPGESEPALHRHLPPVPHRQRRGPSAGDVQWKTISGDLTTGCTGTAPNGARNCTISAIGVGGGRAVYTGSLDGLVNLSTDAQFSDSPTWTRVGKSELPARPVSSIAVDRSNYRTAYVAFNGFNAATPSRPGHVFRTLDGARASPTSPAIFRTRR